VLDPRPLRSATLTLAAANAVGGLVHVAAYFRLGAGDLDAGGRAYLALALLAQLALAALLAAAPALLLSLAAPLRPLAWLTAPLGQAALQLFLEVDRTLLAVLGTHLDRPALEVAWTPGGLASLDLQRGELVRIGAGIAALLAAELLLFAWLHRRARGGRAVPGAARALAAAAVFLFAGERVTYALGLARGWWEPVRAAAVLPAYALEEALQTRVRANDRFRYPRAPLRWRAVEAPPSILWIVIESWRRDGLAPDTTPALWAFSQDALVFADHRSGGNWTYAGVFSLFYGLHAAYAPAAQRSGHGALVLERAQALGYDVRIIASRSTRFPRFRDTIFQGLPEDRIEDDLPGADSAERDRVAVERARDFLARQESGRPFFLAVFLDATHLPYAFAPDSVRFRPYTDRLYYMEMTSPQERLPIYNRYRNALADVDRTAGAILAALRQDGLLDRTAVVLTGDHGQEFYEHGALGHNISFDAEQTAVPLVIRAPGVPHGVRTGLTRHVDVAPTVLGWLGAESPPSDYANGVPLFGGARPDRAVLCGMRDCAVLDASGETTVFRPYAPLAPVRVYDPAWRPLPTARRSPALPEVKRELTAFIE